MKNDIISSKIILFGEYSLLVSSMALGITFDKFKGQLLFYSDKPNKNQSGSNSGLKKYFEFLKTTNLLLNLPRMENELEKGLYFESDIKTGYGIGSSGALVAAIFKRYSIDQNYKLNDLKNIFSLMESFFHGKSSGLDPLICYIEKPILFSSKEIVKIEYPILLDTQKNIKAFLIDTKIGVSTSILIDVFKEKLKQEHFYNMIETRFSYYVDKCIDAVLNSKKDAFIQNIKHLSTLTLEHFKEMIPNDMLTFWEQGLQSETFYLKLCGSGGGGYMLGFTENWQKTKETLKNFELVLIN